MFIKKISEELQDSLNREGYTEPTEFQKLFLKKVNSGKDIVGIGEAGCGKTLTLLIAALHKLKSAFEKAPRVIIVVENDDRVRELDHDFKQLTRYTDLRIDAITDAGNIKDQIDWIFEGTDLVIGTAIRLHEIYLMNGLNVNQLLIFAIDDADKVISQKAKIAIERLFTGLPKCQKMMCAKKFSPRMEQVNEEFMPFAEYVKLA